MTTIAFTPSTYRSHAARIPNGLSKELKAFVVLTSIFALASLGATLFIPMAFASAKGLFALATLAYAAVLYGTVDTAEKSGWEKDEVGMCAGLGWLVSFCLGVGGAMAFVVEASYGFAFS